MADPDFPLDDVTLTISVALMRSPGIASLKSKQPPAREAALAMVSKHIAEELRRANWIVRRGASIVAHGTLPFALAQLPRAERDLHVALKALIDEIRRDDFQGRAGPLVNNRVFLDAEELMVQRATGLQREPGKRPSAGD